MRDIYIAAEDLDMETTSASKLRRIAHEARRHGHEARIEGDSVIVTSDDGDTLTTSSAVALAEWLGY